MKKVVLGLLVLMIAMPAMGTVTITCNTGSGADANKVTVKFTSDEANNVRAFALDITCTDANIIAGSVGEVNPAYYIHPGSFAIVDGNATGTVVCSASYPGTEPGEGTSSMTTEQGSLYEKGVDPAPSQVDQVLFSFRADGECTVSLDENLIRGGVVMENPDEVVSVDTTGTCEVDLGCYNGPDQAEWLAVGEPASWCEPRQCHGDADGLSHTFGSAPPPIAPWPASYVTNEDITILLAGYKKAYSDPVTHPWIAADFNHQENTFGSAPPPIAPWPSARVTNEDITILLTYYKKPDAQIPANCNQ